MRYEVTMTPTGPDGKPRLVARYFSPQAFDTEWGDSPMAWDGQTGAAVAGICDAMIVALDAVAEPTSDVANLKTLAANMKEQCDAAPDDIVSVS